MLRNFFCARGVSELGAGLFAVLAGCLSWPGDGRAAEAGPMHLNCANVVGGATIAIVVDPDHQTVDSLPATVSDKWITWHDPNRGYLDLDRSSLKLDIRIASSTGGYFLHYLCKPE
jgi:hypothetical protein